MKRRSSPAMAALAATLLCPAQAHASGGVMSAVSLEEAVARSEVVVQGKCLGVRRAKVHIDGAALPPGSGALAPGQTALDFEVDELGLRVTDVLASRPGGPKRGDELWLVDPLGYAYGSIGRLAQVAWIVVPQYVGWREPFTKPGASVIAFVETAPHRSARGQLSAGLEGRLLLVESRAYDGSAVAPRVRKLLKKGAGGRR